MEDLDKYLLNPCRTSSIPYWKSRTISIPSHIVILHNDEYIMEHYLEYDDAPYFRLIHNLEELPLSILPEGYSFCEASLDEFAVHIRSCYPLTSVSSDELLAYQNSRVFDASLWIAVRDVCTGQIVASGIAEVDREIGEGVLEWIQVSSDHRRRSLGRCIVIELLRRMENKVDFVTVSGQCYNPNRPEALYRSCGFTGNDIWHILCK